MYSHLVCYLESLIAVTKPHTNTRNRQRHRPSKSFFRRIRCAISCSHEADAMRQARTKHITKIDKSKTKRSCFTCLHVYVGRTVGQYVTVYTYISHISINVQENALMRGSSGGGPGLRTAHRAVSVWDHTGAPKRSSRSLPAFAPAAIFRHITKKLTVT